VAFSGDFHIEVGVIPISKSLNFDILEAQNVG